MSVGGISYAEYGSYTAKFAKEYGADQKSGFSENVKKSEASAGKATESAVDVYRKKHPEDRAHVDEQVKAGKKFLQKNGAEDISRESMSMEEYKLFFTALMDSIPFDASRRGDVEIWSISEKGWEQMKNDPEYEAWVLGYTVENRSVYNPFASWPGYSPNICTEKFGDSIEQHIGQSVPQSSGSHKKSGDSEEESWWEKRNKRLKEIMERTERAARERMINNRKMMQEEMLKRQMAEGARLRQFLTDSMAAGSSEF